MPTAFAVFPHGVIGNTTVFGTVILGSSPGGEAFYCPRYLALCLGWGCFSFSSGVNCGAFEGVCGGLCSQNVVTKLHD